MTTHMIQLKAVLVLSGPAADLTERQAVATLKRLISIGYEDAQATIRQGEGNLRAAQQALNVKLRIIKGAA